MSRQGTRSFGASVAVVPTAVQLFQGFAAVEVASADAGPVSPLGLVLSLRTASVLLFRQESKKPATKQCFTEP